LTIGPERHGVAVCVDGGYALQAGVTVLTLGQHWAEPEPLRVWCFVDASFGSDDEDSLTAVARTVGVDLRVRRVDAELDRVRAELPPVRFPHLSSMAWLRLYLPELLPDCESVLYLDCDVVVCTSVAPLLRRPGGEAVLGAVRDYGIPELGTPHLAGSRFELSDGEHHLPYFNSGLLLIDVARWREREVRQAAERAARTGPDPLGPLFGDQDALNVAIRGEFEVLDPRWNVAPMGAVRQVLDFEFFGEPYLPPSYLRHLEAHPWIMHYVTGIKPWSDDFPDGPARARWRAAASRVRAITGAR
jgi:lipopolysaccharide biosynthesis glycosyltransferase